MQSGVPRARGVLQRDLSDLFSYFGRFPSDQNRRYRLVSIAILISYCDSFKRGPV